MLFQQQMTWYISSFRTPSLAPIQVEEKTVRVSEQSSAMRAIDVLYQVSVDGVSFDICSCEPKS